MQYTCYRFEELAGALLAARSLASALILLELGEPGMLTGAAENVDRLIEQSQGTTAMVGISRCPGAVDSFPLWLQREAKRLGAALQSNPLV